METAAAAMLEAGVGRFQGPSLAALLAEMWAPLAVALAAIATLPSLLRRLQVLILRLRSRGKEVISSHISTYYSSGDDDSDGEEDDDDEAATSSSSEEEEEEVETKRRIGYYEGAHNGAFAWGGGVVRTWQGLPRRLSVGKLSSTGIPAVRLWGASTASGGGVVDDDDDDDAWWDADEGGRGGAGDRRVAARPRAAAVHPPPPRSSQVRTQGDRTTRTGGCCVRWSGVV